MKVRKPDGEVSRFEEPRAAHRLLKSGEYQPYIADASRAWCEEDGIMVRPQPTSVGVRGPSCSVSGATRGRSTDEYGMPRLSYVQRLIFAKAPLVELETIGAIHRHTLASVTKTVL